MHTGETLSAQQYIEAIHSNAAMFSTAAQKNLRAPVPSCPGWFVATLVAHLAEVQHFWALQVRRRAQEPISLPEATFEECPGLLSWFDGVDAGTPDLDAIPATLLDWFESGARELVEAFQAVQPDEPIWHWSGDNRAITHMRNQAIEAAVHRWDAENAQGETSPIQETVALDGIDQHFQVQIPAARKGGEALKGSGESYHFHRMDGPGEWLVRFEEDQVIMSHAHAKADIAIRGPLELIFLWLWRRVPSDGLEVLGDRSLLDRYRRLVPPSQ